MTDTQPYDHDEAQQVLMAAQNWIDARNIPDRDKALRDFTEWLRAFVVAQIDRRGIGREIERAIENHKLQEWHR